MTLYSISSSSSSPTSTISSKKLSVEERFSKLLFSWKDHPQPSLLFSFSIMQSIFEILHSRPLNLILLKDCLQISLAKFYFQIKQNYLQNSSKEEEKGEYFLLQNEQKQPHDVVMNHGKKKRKRKGKMHDSKSMDFNGEGFVDGSGKDSNHNDNYNDNDNDNDNNSGDNSDDNGDNEYEDDDGDCVDSKMMRCICLLKKIIIQASSFSPPTFSLFVSQILDHSFQSFNDEKNGFVRENELWNKKQNEKQELDDCSPFSFYEQNRKRNEDFFPPLQNSSLTSMSTQRRSKSLLIERSRGGKGKNEGETEGREEQKKKTTETRRQPQQQQHELHQTSKNPKNAKSKGYSKFSKTSEFSNLVREVLHASISKFGRNKGREKEKDKEENKGDMDCAWSVVHPSSLFSNLLFQTFLQTNQMGFIKNQDTPIQSPFLPGHVLKCFESNSFLYIFFEIFLESSPPNMKTNFLPILEILLQAKITLMQKRKNYFPATHTTTQSRTHSSPTKIRNSKLNEEMEDCKRLFHLSCLSGFLPLPFSKCILVFHILDGMDVLNCFVLMQRFIRNCISSMQTTQTTTEIKNPAGGEAGGDGEDGAGMGAGTKSLGATSAIFPHVLDKSKLDKLNEAMDWEEFLFSIYRKHIHVISIHFFHVFPVVF